jgi:ABC-type nitrate/sulfonate/bicarbonate transport system substrate-binding protein
MQRLTSRRWQHLLRLWLVAMGILLAGCGQRTPDAGAGPKAPTSVQFSWVHTIEFVGFYEAARQNYYNEANLDVRLDKGGFDASGAYIDPVARVVSGASDFGIAGADVVLKARAEGQPIVAVAAIYQRSPVVLISLAEKKIVQPQDLVGRRIAIQPPNSTLGISYEAFLRSQHIDHAQLQESPRTDYNTVDVLFNDETDVLPGFITNDGMKAKQRSDTAQFIVLSDYGIDIYSNVIFTTEKLIKERPELVEGFLRATIQGMQWAVENPDKTVEHVLATYGSEMPPEIQATQQPGMQASIALINPAGSPSGQMTAEAWAYAHQVLLDQGILKQPIAVEAAYNLEFLERIYSQ